MTVSPCLVRSVSTAGAVRHRLGDPLLDRYLEFVAGRARPNTLRAVAFDLKTFFAVVAKERLVLGSGLRLCDADHKLYSLGPVSVRRFRNWKEWRGRTAAPIKQGQCK